MNKWKEFDENITPRESEQLFSCGKIIGALTRNHAVACAKPEYCKKPRLLELRARLK